MAALIAAKPTLVATAVFSGAINLLMLGGPLFMLQVYDRVIPSRSVPTLQALVLLILGIYGFQALLERLRSRLFARVGQQIDTRLSPLVFAANIRRGLAGQSAQGAPFRDLEQLRNFLAGGGPAALFDLPWMPLYLLFLFLLHPLLGLFGVAGAATLGALAWLTERGARSLQSDLSSLSAEAGSMAEAARRNAEAVAAMGMTDALSRTWGAKNEAAGRAVLDGSDVIGRYGGWTRFVRLALQSLVLAVGAGLVIAGAASGGVMIAASILLGRALAPVELAITHWRGLVGARQAFRRLQAVLAEPGLTAIPGVALPAPNATVTAAGVAVAAPGQPAPYVRGVNFDLQKGDALGIIGPSGSGKSTLARALVGAWPLAGGSMRLDGSTLDQWSSQEAGRFIGYLPQTVELFAGTVAQNIARFDPTPRMEDILQAAAEAGVDALVRTMPDGFDTQVGDGGGLLSAGQRQRIALARGVCRVPFLLVLDEPNSALDAVGEAALTEAILSVRRRDGVAIIIAHRPSALQACNKVLVLAEGQQRGFGPRDEVLKSVLAPVPNRAQAS
jgi:PrtD family type I secretion system ABC transporter